MADHLTSEYQCEAGHWVGVLNAGTVPKRCPQYHLGSPCGAKLHPVGKGSRTKQSS